MWRAIWRRSARSPRPGADIHNHQPSPRDISDIADADLVLVNGLNLDQWAQQYLDRAGDVPIVTVSEGVEPMPIRGANTTATPMRGCR